LTGPLPEREAPASPSPALPAVIVYADRYGLELDAAEAEFRFIPGEEQEKWRNVASAVAAAAVPPAPDALRRAVLAEVLAATSCAGEEDGGCPKCKGHADAILAAVSAHPAPPAGQEPHAEPASWDEVAEQPGVTVTCTFTWDYRVQPPMKEIAGAVEALSGGTVAMSMPETESDEYELVITRPADDIQGGPGEELDDDIGNTIPGTGRGEL